MKKYNTQAIVLKNIKYKDADKIFTLFTKDYGKISAIARGVRKINSRRSGNLDTLNLISLSIHEDDHSIRNIEEAKTIESFRDLKKDLNKSVKAFYIAELILKSTEEDENIPRVFDLIVKTLRAINKNSYEGDLFVCYFEMNLMKLLGYELTLDKCKKCGRVLSKNWKKYFFNVDNGGIECEKCSKFGISLTKEACLYLHNISIGKLTKEMQLKVEEIDKLMKIYISRKIESKFKSLEIV